MCTSRDPWGRLYVRASQMLGDFLPLFWVKSFETNTVAPDFGDTSRQTCNALFSYETEFRKKAEKHSHRIQHGKKGRGEQL